MKILTALAATVAALTLMPVPANAAEPDRPAAVIVMPVPTEYLTHEEIETLDALAAEPGDVLTVTYKERNGYPLQVIANGVEVDDNSPLFVPHGDGFPAYDRLLAYNADGIANVFDDDPTGTLLGGGGVAPRLLAWASGDTVTDSIGGSYARVASGINDVWVEKDSLSTPEESEALAEQVEYEARFNDGEGVDVEEPEPTDDEVMSLVEDCVEAECSALDEDTMRRYCELRGADAGEFADLCHAISGTEAETATETPSAESTPEAETPKASGSTDSDQSAGGGVPVVAVLAGVGVGALGLGAAKRLRRRIGEDSDPEASQ